MSASREKTWSLVKFVLAVIAGFFLVQFVITNFGRRFSPQDEVLASWEGRPAPELTFTTTEGESVKLSDLRGRAVILDFWATWCGPCMQEIPHFKELQKEYGDKIAVVGISSESIDVLKEFVSSSNPGYRIGIADALPAPFSDIRAIPTTFFIDGEGTVRRVVLGYHDIEELRHHLVDTIDSVAPKS